MRRTLIMGNAITESIAKPGLQRSPGNNSNEIAITTNAIM